MQPDLSFRRKVGLLGALYFTQGLPFGFQAVAIPVYLRARGVSLTDIGLLGLLALPWALKPLWAPLVDRFGSRRIGRRRTWIIPAQLALVLACLGAAAAAASGSLNWLLTLVFGMNLCAAVQDVAVDGLALDLLSSHELGVGNTAQVAGYKVGMVTGGGLLVWSSQWIGWTGLFLVMSVLVALVLLIVLGFREPDSTRQPGPGDPPVSVRRLVRQLIAQLASPTGRWLLLFVATYKLGESIIDRMFKPFLVDVGFGESEIGLWVGTWGMVASIVGSALGGWLATARGPWFAIAVAATLRLVPLVAQWALTLGTPGPEAVILATCAEHLFGGALTTAMFAFMMARVDRRIGATHYTVLAAVEVLGKAPGGLLSGVLVDALGYPWTFGLGILLAAAFLLLLPIMRRATP